MPPKSSSDSGKKATPPVASNGAAVNGNTKHARVKPAAARAVKPAGKRTTLKQPTPMSEEHLDSISGIPTDAEVDQQLGDLGPEDQKTLKKIKRLLATHLGSAAAAR